MKNETQKINNYWVIGTNKWSANIYTQEQAEEYAKTLVNCNGCIDCRYCRGCYSCRDCLECSSCRDCIDCRNCIDCRGCIGCSNCSSCSNFKTNPERIISPKLGSRDAHTTFYWNEEHEQIACGCFKGTLKEFEEKVIKTHGDNDYAKGYLKWIESVKNFKETYGGNK
jgi:hypothetical protein